AQQALPPSGIQKYEFPRIKNAQQPSNPTTKSGKTNGINGIRHCTFRNSRRASRPRTCCAHSSCWQASLESESLREQRRRLVRLCTDVPRTTFAQAFAYGTAADAAATCNGRGPARAARAAFGALLRVGAT